MWIKILSWLCYHANTGYRSQKFYAVKNKLLAKYGKLVGYDTQFFEGSDCWTCNGTGIYHGYSYRGSFKDICNRCGGTGRYHMDRYVLLERIQFGKYIFHSPKESTVSMNKKQFTIQGYIRHEQTKYCDISRFILFILFEKNYLKRWYKEFGTGWRVKPNTFIGYLNNVVHLIKKGKNAVPFHINRLRKQEFTPVNQDDLPF